MAETVVKKLITQLVLDDSKHALKIKDAQGSYVNLRRISKTLSIGIGAVGAAMAAVGTTAALLTKQTVAQGDKFDKLSQRIGISVEKLSAYSHAANLSGTSLEGMANSIGHLSRNMLTASEGIGEGMKAFERLNISTTDSEEKLKDTNSILIEIAGRFSKMPDGAEKTALSMLLLGRAGREMIPMLNQGAEGMRKMLEEGEKLRGWTTAQAKEAALLNDNWTRITTAAAGVKDMIGKALIPVFQAGVQAFMQFSDGGKDILDGVLKRFPDVIREWVIPAFSTFLEVSNTIITAVKVGWNGLQYAINSVVEFIFRDINALVQGITRVGSKIPGIGKTIQNVAFISQAAYDTITEAVQKNANAIDKNLEDHQKNRDKISELQDSLVIKYTESQKRMEEASKETNDKILDNFVTTNTKIDEEQQKRQEEIVSTEQGLQDRLNQLTEDQFDYARIKLEEEYEEKRKNVEDKKLLDEWYNAEWKRIQEAEGQEELKRADKRRKEEEKIYREKHAFRLKLQDSISDAIIAGGNLEENITKATGKVVIDTLQEGAKKKLQILVEAAIKVITGHVAEGLSMVGASSLSVWDAIPNVLAYGASIAAQIAGAKLIAKKINFAGGGWLSSHPQGGVINQGSTGRADDVFLGSHGMNDYYGSRGESVFVMNEPATRKFLPVLSAFNISTGFAGGGLIGRALSGIGSHSTYTNGMSKDEQIATAANNIGFGLMKHALVGWAMAGDWLQGIGPGASSAGANAGTMIPAMFAGKVLGNSKAKHALGFGLGGFIKMFTDPVGYLEDKIGFGDIKDWIMAATRYIPGAREIGGALVGSSLSMPKINFMDTVKNITRANFIKSMLDMNLMFHNGGVITSAGMEHLGPNEVPFAGIGQVGEVLSPAGATGNNVNINVVLHGIDRKNARSVVNDYIIPELNYYLTSRGGSRI